MKKLIFFISLSLLTLVGCEERKYECTDVWENHDVECCGIKDPLNNLEWLNEIHLKYKSQYLYGHKAEILCLKYENKTTKEHSILFYKHKVYPRRVSTHYCNGDWYFSGILGASPEYIDIFTSNQYTRSSESMEPHMNSDIWNTFVQENVLMDTLAIYTYN